MEAEKAKIRKEYERKESQVEVKKKMCVRRERRARHAPPFARLDQPRAQCRPPRTTAGGSCARRA